MSFRYRCVLITAAFDYIDESDSRPGPVPGMLCCGIVKWRFACGSNFDLRTALHKTRRLVLWGPRLKRERGKEDDHMSC